MTSPPKKNTYEGLYEIFLLYFDDTRGNMPLLIYPDENIKNDPKKMQPINIHTIWFFDMKDQAMMDYVDLEYHGNIYFARKFSTLSKQKNNITGYDIFSTEIMVMMIALPIDIHIFGADLLNQLTINIIKNFEGKLYHLIESENAKEELLKTPKVKAIISKGEKLKERIKDIISVTCKNFFSLVVKEKDIKSIKEQRALSYLALKGLDSSIVVNGEENEMFSNVRLFDSQLKSKAEPFVGTSLKISNIKLNERSKELEIIVQNKTEKEFNNISVKITHMKDYIEKDIMEHIIDIWFPREELLFVSPIVPNINVYNLFIKEEDNHLLSKKIDLDILNITKP